MDGASCYSWFGSVVTAAVAAGLTAADVAAGFGAFVFCPDAEAFSTKSEIDSSYTRLMGYLFRSAKAFTIATHDPGIMDEAMLLGRSYRKRVTYEIPIGVKSKYAEELASLGYRVAIGVPFGRRWTGYAYGRLSDELGTVPLLRRLLSSA